jgi:lysine biosynthesis protein LysW
MSNYCPRCKAPLNIPTPVEIKQQVTCENCGMELEVVWLYPLELARVIGYLPDAKNEGERQKVLRGK